MFHWPLWACDVRTQSEGARRDCADVWDKPGAGPVRIDTQPGSNAEVIRLRRRADPPRCESFANIYNLLDSRASTTALE
jgi:hypothetical protein